MKDTKHLPVWHPRHWPLWVLLIILRMLVFLPLPVQLSMGRQLGRLLSLSKRRTHIARVNFQRCFPQYTEQQIERLLAENFANVGMAIFETISSWWMSDRRLKKSAKINGLEKLYQSYGKEKGVILFSAHFTMSELGGRLVAMKVRELPINVMYRPNENSLLEAVLYRARKNKLGSPIGKDDIRSMIKALRNKEIVWYAADQDYSGKSSVFAPFFGIPASTNTGTSKMVALTGAKVLPYAVKRVSDKGLYEITIMDELDNFPSGDDIADATITNGLIESWVKQAPEQYLWIHRRFKTRPEGEAGFYEK